MLLCNAFYLELFGTLASILIALAATFQSFYIIIYQSKKDKKRNEKEWFHRLVIEPKIDEIYQFFSSTEEEFNNLKNLIGSDFSLKEALASTNRLKNLIFNFRKSFIHFIYPIDKDLAVELKYEVDNFLDFYTNKLYQEKFGEPDSNEIYNEFSQVKSQIISLLYKWNN